MKFFFTLLISSTLLLTIVSCNNNNDDSVSATGVILQDSATLFLGNTIRLTAIVLPENATNKNVVWQSTDSAIASVSNAVVSGLTAGTTSIVATTQDGNFTDTAVVAVGTFSCNSNTPGWGESLGTVSFHTNQTWIITGNGITQTWSDAVTATTCQKATFAGGTIDWNNLEDSNFSADCRSNPDFPGDLFSWCAIVRFADQLCPYPWRVPTTQDFRDLDIAMGGTGNSRTDSGFVNANYINRWGGAFGGYSVSYGRLRLQDLIGRYWSQSELDAMTGRGLTFSPGGAVWPQVSNVKNYGFALRCVR
ncbi:MAG: Ig-like domain-containing protein [Bacteroidales bacterium]|nr:Ig-like domain-containing protein [Bacteroidales bacterium]